MARLFWCLFSALVCLPVFVFQSHTASAQVFAQGDWTWMGGQNSIPGYTDTNSGILGVYGTLGSFGPANSPGSRKGAANWRDASGNLWMFGGSGYAASSGLISYLHDLWEYRPAIRQWAWMGGSSSTSSA